MAGSSRKRRERLLNAARGYLFLEMPDHALTELSSIQDPDRSALAYYELKGEALKQKGDFREALQAYARALAEKPGELSLLLGMAWCYKRTGQLPRSIAAMQDAYRAHPDEPIVLYNLACYYALAGEKALALSWLGRALRMKGSLRKLIPEETDFDPLRGDPDFHFVAGTQEDEADE